MNITHHKNGEIKTLVDEAPYHPGYEDVGFKPKEMNNEPVAWMYERLDGSAKVACQKMKYDSNVVKEIPLYTTPHQASDVKQIKELSDEEIDTIVRDFFGEVNSFYDFRLVIRRCIDKAILRKAQDK